jgi:NAD+ synthase
MSIAIFQANPTMGAIPDNVAALEATANNLPPGTKLLVAPELYLLGYPPDDLVQVPSVLAAVRDALDHLAHTLRDGPAVLVGAPIADARGVTNTAVLIERGAWRVVAEKMILPNEAVFDDKRVFVPGFGPGMIELDGKAYGVIVCEDCWHPEPLEKLLTTTDTMISQIIVMNASPFERGKLSQRHNVLRQRVRRAQLPYLYVNIVGGQDEIVFDGGSFVMDAKGAVTAQFPQFEAGVYDVANPPKQNLSGGEEVYQALMLGTRDYVRKNGFTKVCLGLSGGVDSALVATIAVDALGADNVTAMILPSEYSSPETQADAHAQAARLGIKASQMSIAPARQLLEKSLTAVFGESPNDIAAQNLQSRLRGLALMALSNQTGALLLTTGNKSELAVGYATLYGDMNGGFNPIKDLYKTDVYQICAWRNAAALNDLSYPMLPSILLRAPSAELRPGQTDQDTLPPYELLDDILRALIEGNARTELLTKFDAALVKKIQGWLDRNEYKRRQAAPGVKVTSKAFGRDRRWPMTNKFTK